MATLRRVILVVLSMTIGAMAYGQVNDDEVLVVIDGHDTIKVDEFVRSFETNRVGLAESLTVAEYLDDYIIFKLNVLSARAAKADTLFNFDADKSGESRDFHLADYSIERYLANAGLNNSDSLSRFFSQRREQYKWDKPRFKGVVICLARGESAQALESILMAVNNDIERAEPLLKNRYGRNIKVSRVVLPQGVNAIVDYLVFAGPMTDEVAWWSACRVVDGRIISQPEDFNDIKGPVMNDYQKMVLERQKSELKASHNVKINQKALKKIESLVEKTSKTSSGQNL